MLGYLGRRVGMRLEVQKGWWLPGQAIKSSLESRGHCVLDVCTSGASSAGQLRLLSIWSQHTFHLTQLNPPINGGLVQYVQAACLSFSIPTLTFLAH